MIFYFVTNNQNNQNKQPKQSKQIIKTMGCERCIHQDGNTIICFRKDNRKGVDEKVAAAIFKLINSDQLSEPVKRNHNNGTLNGDLHLIEISGFYIYSVIIQKLN